MLEIPLDPEWLTILDWGQGQDDGPDPALVERLLDAIEALPEPLRDVVNGVFYEQVSKQELATRAGVSPPEVNRRLKRALVLLKEALA